MAMAMDAFTRCEPSRASRSLTALAIVAAASSSAPAARADIGFALHGEGAATHIAGDRSSQFGWGGTGLVAPELLLGRKIGLELPVGFIGVSAGAHQDPAYMRSSSGFSFFVTPGVRVRPLAMPARGWGDAIWIAAGGGVADTGGLVRPAVDARGGVDLRAGRVAVGPYLGFMEIIDVQSGPLRRDASLALVGLHGQWERRPAARPTPAVIRDVAPADVDGTPDMVDACPNGPPTADPCEEHEAGRIVAERPEIFRDFAQRILFAYDSAVVGPEGFAALRRIAEGIKSHEEYRRISVQGHADDRGGDGYNMRLSESRAKAVRAALIDLGVDPTRLEIAYFGNRRPRRLGRSESARRENRRVEFNLIRASFDQARSDTALEVPDFRWDTAKLDSPQVGNRSAVGVAARRLALMP